MDQRQRILVSIAGTITGAISFLAASMTLGGTPPILYLLPGLVGGTGLAVCETRSDTENPPHPLSYALFGVLGLLVGLALTYTLQPVQVPDHLDVRAPAMMFMGPLDYLSREISVVGLMALLVGIIGAWNIPVLARVIPR